MESRVISKTEKVSILIDKPKKRHIYYFFKRLMDIVCSIFGIIVFAPVFLITAIIVKADGGPALFVQTRVCKGGKFFRMYKFRSMSVNAERMVKHLKHMNEADGLAFKIENGPRVTKIGKFIRSTSIDELPQLFNVLKGEMSIVGPRPPLGHEVYHYDEYQIQRLKVKPGLTCYWQCSSRCGVTFDEWMDMDIKYIKERNLWVDIKIVLKTIPAVLLRKGAC